MQVSGKLSVFVRFREGGARALLIAQLAQKSQTLGEALLSGMTAASVPEVFVVLEQNRS